MLEITIYNPNGNTVAITDSAESIVNKYAYTPFGAIVNQVEAVPQPFKFVGEAGVMAESIGLYYMKARYYNPTLGRFISGDPLGFGGDGPNFYAYVKNNPVNYTDPLGLASFGKRPLGPLPFMINGETDDVLNTEISHEHMWFDDGKSPSNIGFGSDGLFIESDSTRSRYSMSPEYYDDNLLREAVDNNRNTGNYCLIGNNCQDWAERVRKEYERLRSEGQCR